MINGLAIGIISTSSDAVPFSASWSFVEVYEGSGDGFPTGQLDAAPPAVVFPETLVGESAVQTVTLSNTGGAALEINAAILTGNPAFVVDLPLPQSLEPGASQDFSISFTPDAATGFQAVLTLTHDGGNSPLEISMTGAGAEVATVPVPDPGQVDFGGVLVGSTIGQELINLTNTGQASVTVGNLGTGGEHAGDFILDAATDSCTGAKLASGQGCSFAVRFQPTQTGARGAQVDIPSDAGAATVSLQGQGLVLLDLQIEAAPSPAIAGSPLTYTLIVSNLTSVPAENVALAITLPSETSLLTTDGCLEDPTGIPNCSIGPIPANESAEIAIIVDVSSSSVGTILFQATASADHLLDPVAQELTTPVVLVADLNLVMGGDAVMIDVETMEVLYVIIVGNGGPSDAVSAMVMTELAPGLENIEWNCQAEATANCTLSGLGEIDDLADLPAGTSVTYQLTATVPSLLIEKGITSSANVAPTGEATDPNLDNNRDSVTIGDRLFHDRFEVLEE